VNTVHNPIPRYNVDTQLDDCQLSLFSRRGDTTSHGVPRHLTDEEWITAMLYVLTNLNEVDEYLEYVNIFFNIYVSKRLCSDS
jgi:hypothetical protein